MTIQPSLSLSQIPANSLQLDSVFTEIFKQLRTLTTEEETLQAGVEIVHQILIRRSRCSL
ncbi:MAG TPA: hypothetical protein V6C71_26725 [Coleofasciculaceae cyanobacterium]|jgi:hypothetical protein